MAKSDIAAVEQTLGEPVLEELTEETRRSRRNLLVISCVAVFYRLADLKISKAGFLGIQFDSVPTTAIDIGLMAGLLYFVAQFGWKALDHVQHVRIRVTGNRVVHVTTGQGASEHGDYPSDPRQSSLYNWWVEDAKRIGSLREPAEELIKIGDLLKDVASNAEFGEMPNIHRVTDSATEINKDAHALIRKVDQAIKTFESARIPASLERFDRWFWRFQWSQIYRLLVLDIGVPLLLGLFGLGLMWFV